MKMGFRECKKRLTSLDYLYVCMFDFKPHAFSAGEVLSLTAYFWPNPVPFIDKIPIE